MLRHPAVAGTFYEGSPQALRRQVESCLVPAAVKTAALGIIAPHAGLMYSGPVAGAVYSHLTLPDSVILIGPNHTGLGAPVAVMAGGEWETPFGKVSIDAPLAAALLAASPRLHEDRLAHLREHSLEVQLPFLQYFKPSIKIVPVQMLDVRLETCREVGRAVAAAVRERGGGVLVIASSDMTHYETAAEARIKDRKAIDHVLALDPDGLYRTVRDHDITMCGFGPAVAMLVACKEMGATRAELVRYANSGEASGDFEQVVGYAGIIVM